jgi:hypothetical protein
LNAVNNETSLRSNVNVVLISALHVGLMRVEVRVDETKRRVVELEAHCRGTFVTLKRVLATYCTDTQGQGDIP